MVSTRSSMAVWLFVWLSWHTDYDFTLAFHIPTTTTRSIPSSNDIITHHHIHIQSFPWHSSSTIRTTSTTTTITKPQKKISSTLVVRYYQLDPQQYYVSSSGSSSSIGEEFFVSTTSASQLFLAPLQESSSSTTTTTILSSVLDSTYNAHDNIIFSSLASTMDSSTAEQLAGPFFGASLFPYLGFLFFLNVPQNETPRGVTVGFATCLLFVFLTIPAAIVAKVWYNVSLADCDWLHGSAESLLTITNLVTVLAFRQALSYREGRRQQQQQSQSQQPQQQQQQQQMEETTIQQKNREDHFDKTTKNTGTNNNTDSLNNPTTTPSSIPQSYVSYQPMIKLVGILTSVAFVTALIPAMEGATTHTPYLGGFMDLPPVLSIPSSSSFFPSPWQPFGLGIVPLVTPRHVEPENALTVATWIIHISSLVEFLVAMGYCWRWADITNNPRWKGLTWGLIPLHSSGITACTYHLFYNSIPILVPLQALLTLVGNTTAMYAAYRIAVSNGWSAPWKSGGDPFGDIMEFAPKNRDGGQDGMIGFEDLGDALAEDTDFSFTVKLFAGCAVASYIIKNGELWFDFPFESELSEALAFIFIPSMLNAFKWHRRSKDPNFEGWF